MSDLMELVQACESIKHDNKKATKALEKSKQLEALGFRDLSIMIAEKAKTEERLNRLSEYKYIRISKDSIAKFLNKKAAAYNKEHEMRPGLRDAALGAYERLVGRQSQARTASEIAFQNGSLAELSGRGLGMASGGPSFTSVSWQRYRTLYDETNEHPGVRFGDEVLAALTIHAMSSVEGTIGKFVWTETRVEEYKTIPPNNALQALEEHKAREVFDYFTIASVNAVKDPLLLGRITGHEDRYFIAQWGDDVALDDVI